MSRLFFAIALLVPALASATPVTFESLLHELTDLERLTRLPEPAYINKQFSSYDRRSTDPEVKTDENWFANGDRGQHIRLDQGPKGPEYVLMDAAGPGAIVRIWSANPDDAGNVRIYLDGAEEPVIDVALTKFLSGEHELAPKPLAGERSRGWNTHLPIPYAKHCKVTTTKGDYYYHINYRTYEAGTEVETFTLELSKNFASDVSDAAEALAAPREQANIPRGGSCKDKATLAPAGKIECKLEGTPAAIYEIRTKVDSEDMEAALRGLLIEISFDGKEPAVVAPLGDFFGTAPGANSFESLPCGLEKDGTLYSHWIMPYQRSAHVQIVNTTKLPIAIESEIANAPYQWSDDSLYFHAKWRAARDVATQPRQDWNYVTASGDAGRFVGCMLHITNSVTDWWGEGDEKIFVDGEKFPSTFGTGSEDYFGYAWCHNQPFTHAYHNQPRVDGPGNYGQTCNSRFHVIDDIPFTGSLQFDMEIWHWVDTKVDLSTIAYWYAAPGAKDNFEPIDTTLLTVPQPREIVYERVEGAIEAEEMKVVKTSGGKTETQTNTGWKWSNGTQLWWTQGKPGDVLELEFNVEKAGRYKVFAVFTRAGDYGIAQCEIRGEPAGDAIGFWNTEVRKTEEIEIGTHELEAGANTFSAEILGKNAAATDYMFGLDYLRLETVE